MSERDERIKELWGQGVIARVIGAELGLDESSIRKQVRRLGLKLRREYGIHWSEEDIATLTQLWKDGHNGLYIAGVLKRSRNAVMGKLHRLGLQRGYLPKEARPKVDKLPTVRPVVEQKVRKFSPRPRTIVAPWKEVKRPVVVEPIEGPKPSKEGITIIELTPFSCREVIGQGRFCGKTIYYGSYCTEHAEKNYRKVA